MDVLPLARATDISKFGGKASNLARLIKGSFNVPDGLALAVTAFDNDGNPLPSVEKLVQEWLSGRPDSMRYAVRSSALEEDGEHQSWAGQFDTYLDIKAKDVINMVVACHNAKSARAKAYGGGKNAKFKIAVIIQEMVHPDYAGVAFTNNPVDGSSQIVIEYTVGLADDLVSGEVDPDVLTWDRNAKRPQPNISPFDSNMLINTALGIEKLYGVPQDIEWAFVGNSLYIVQSRPITTLAQSMIG